MDWHFGEPLIHVGNTFPVFFSFVVLYSPLLWLTKSWLAKLRSSLL